MIVKNKTFWNVNLPDISPGVILTYSLIDSLFNVSMKFDEIHDYRSSIRAEGFSSKIQHSFFDNLFNLNLCKMNYFIETVLSQLTMDGLIMVYMYIYHPNRNSDTYKIMAANIYKTGLMQKIFSSGGISSCDSCKILLYPFEEISPFYEVFVFLVLQNPIVFHFFFQFVF